MRIVILTFNPSLISNNMSQKVPLYEIGLAKEDPATELVMSKLDSALEKSKSVLSDIIEAKISVKSQNPEGSRTHYDATFTVITSKKRLTYTDEGWDILKIADNLSRKLEGELTKHDDQRQRDSVRKRSD